MFFKISKTINLSSLVKPVSYFSTAAKPLLLKTFPNKCDSNSSFTIKQLEERDIDEASACLSEAFSSREMITNHFQIKYSLLYEGIKKDLQRALDANLCLVCQDKTTEKIAGVIYYEDLNEVLDPKICQNHTEQDEDWSKLDEFYQYLYSFISPFAEPKERNDVLLCKKFAVAKEFESLGVASNLMFAARYIHPRTTKAKRRVMIISSEKSYNFALKHGYKLIKKLDFKDSELFQNMDSDSKLGNIYIVKYEPTEGISLIQELKDLFAE